MWFIVCLLSVVLIIPFLFNLFSALFGGEDGPVPKLLLIIILYQLLVQVRVCVYNESSVVENYLSCTKPKTTLLAGFASSQSHTLQESFQTAFFGKVFGGKWLKIVGFDTFEDRGHFMMSPCY